MTIANDIISCKMPDFERYVRAGESLDDIDEYGFTPLIESAITRQVGVAEALLKRGVDVNKPDVAGRTALHWAVDNNQEEMVRLLLKYRANPNAYTPAGLSVLVYPVLRSQNNLKHLLYRHHAKLEFAQDFILAKLLGHRFELQGDVDIVNAGGEFIELNYEGFILEFTVAVIEDTLNRFISSYSTKHLRPYFHHLYNIIDAFSVASELLKLQHQVHFSKKDQQTLSKLIQSKLLVLPVASRGHAMSFIKYGSWWIKIDRGENSLKEGSVNVYTISRPEAFNLALVQELLYKKQPRDFFHKTIIKLLGLKHRGNIPLSSQISGNCSWANIQAVVLGAYSLLNDEPLSKASIEQAKIVYESYLEWDKDRALDECIQRFYIANPVRKASLVAMLGGVLFQACDHFVEHDLKRAEKILTVLTLPEYIYVLESYLDIYCVKRLTPKGNNLLKLLDDCGVNPKIGVSPIATGLPERQER